ncbi:MAG: ParB/RepB/Spo0J family partition protein [Burkholderiaceae bacterium]|nr:ParB/RepB/Spo0J family partition protein [Burkholderiaceae bacterium]
MRDDNPSGLSKFEGTSLQELFTTMKEVDLIDPDPNQPRKNASEPDSLGVLKTSFKHVNIIEPITVRPHPHAPGRLMIVVGERRWCAAVALGVKLMPVIVREGLTAQDVFKLQLAENFKGGRVNLSPAETADAVEKLQVEMGMDQPAVAAYLEMSQPWVNQVVALKHLAPEVAEFKSTHPDLTTDRTAIITLDKLAKIDASAAMAAIEKSKQTKKKLSRQEMGAALKAAKTAAKVEKDPVSGASSAPPKDGKALDAMLGADGQDAASQAHGDGALPLSPDGASADGAQPTSSGAPGEAFRAGRVNRKKVVKVAQLLGLREDVPLDDLLDRLLDEYMRDHPGAIVQH